MTDHEAELAPLLAQLPAMRERFLTAPGRHGQYTERVARQSHSEVWSRRLIYSAQPLRIERDRGERPGRALKKKPGRLGGTVCTGFNPDGTVAHVFEYTDDAGRHYAQFWDHADNAVETALFDYFDVNRAINVERIELSNGRPVRFLRFAAMGVLVETYHYEGGAIAAIHSIAKEHDAVRSVHSTDMVARDEQGAVERIVRHWTAGNVSEQIYPS